MITILSADDLCFTINAFIIPDQYLKENKKI